MSQSIEIKSAYELSLDRLEQCFIKAGAALRDASVILGSMSKIELQKAKQRFKMYASSDYIERLALLGQGKLPEHLALPMRPLIRASLWKILPPKTKKFLEDKEATVELLTTNGVSVRPVTSLSAVELDRVLDPHEGILAAEKQQNKMLVPAKPLAKKELSAYVFDSLRKVDNLTVMIYARDPEDEPGTQKVCVKIPLKTLKSLV